MNIVFKDFRATLLSLPPQHLNPMWDGAIVDLWLQELGLYSRELGLVNQYLEDLWSSEVCLIDGLPYASNMCAYLSQPSSWLVDATYCAGKLMETDRLRAAINASAARWKTSVDVPAILGEPGDLKTKVCHFDLPHKSKQRNEQKQALTLHAGYTVEPVREVPFAFMMDSVDYWLSQGADPVSSITAHCWSQACARFGHGQLFKFQSPLGLAYIGITDIGGALIFNTFFQSLNRPSRIGTAALTAVVGYLRDNSKHRMLYLDSPRWGEDTSYAVYKSHLANGEESVNSLLAFHPSARPDPHYCAENQQWM